MRIPAGNRLRVSISTTYWPMMWPAPEPVTLTIDTRESFVELPVRPLVAAEREPDFPPPEGARAVRRRVISKPSNTRELTVDQASGETRLSIVDDFGRHEILEHGLVTWECGREHYSIMPGDPLSARQEAHWTEEYSRGRWHIRTETFTELKATATHWIVNARLEAFEGKKKILTRRWSERIERLLG
jgi:hypothetical protein